MTPKVVAFVEPTKANPTYMMLHFEPILVDDVITFVSAKPVLTAWVDKYKVAVGSKVAFQED